MAKIKVTLIKSTIACIEKQKATVAALGLRKIGSSNVIEDNACTRGMIKVVSHLVKVENVEED
jgi:large subunit ribosomal protein L30